MSSKVKHDVSFWIVHKHWNLNGPCYGFFMGEVGILKAFLSSDDDENG